MKIREIFEQRVSQLTNAQMGEIKKYISKGAKVERTEKDVDVPNEWRNALELVNWAYNKAGIRTPESTEKELWRQYEENISISVKELARNRGLNGSWRLNKI